MTGPRPSEAFPAVDPARDLPKAVDVLRRDAPGRHPYDALLYGMSADVLEAASGVDIGEGLTAGEVAEHLPHDLAVRYWRTVITRHLATTPGDDRGRELAERELTDDEKRDLGRRIADALDPIIALARDDEIDHANSDGDVAEWLGTLSRELYRYGWVMDERVLRGLAPLAGLPLAAPAEIEAGNADPPELWWHPVHSVIMPTVVDGHDYGWYVLEQRTWLAERPDGAVRMDRLRTSLLPPSSGGGQGAGVRCVSCEHAQSHHGPTPSKSGEGRCWFEVGAPLRRAGACGCAEFVAPAGPQAEGAGETAIDERLADCVANWSGCYDDGHDPRCCRFPKACSPYPRSHQGVESVAGGSPS